VNFHVYHIHSLPPHVAVALAWPAQVMETIEEPWGNDPCLALQPLNP